MKKRILSCILALTMLFGMMPAALAEEAPEAGLYRDAGLTDKIATCNPYPGQEVVGYRLNYTVGDGLTLYYYEPTETVTVKAPGGNTLFTSDGDTHITTITIPTTWRNLEELTICIGEGANLPLILDPVYKLPNDHQQLYNNGNIFLSCPINGECRLSPTIAPDGDIIGEEGWTATITAGLGEIFYGGGAWRWAVNCNTFGATGYITFSNGTDYYSIAVETTAPYVGVYSSDTITADGYISAVNGICNVQYNGSSGTRAVYLIPRFNDLQSDFTGMTNDKVDVTMPSDRCVKIALKESVTSGSVRFDLPYKLVGDNNDLTCRIFFEDVNEPDPGLYSDAALTSPLPVKNNVPYLSFTPGETATVYGYFPAYGGLSGQTNHLITTETLQNGALAITLVDEFYTNDRFIDVFLPFTNGPTVTVRFDADANLPANTAAHTLTDSEKLPAKWQDYDSSDAGPVAFTYNSETYYVGRGHDQPDLYGGDFPNQDEVITASSRINFWTKDKEGNYRAVNDAALRQTLRDQFSSITVKLYADVSPFTGEFPLEYPAISYLADGRIQYTYNNKNSCQWVYVVEATLKNDPSNPLYSITWFHYEYAALLTYDVNSVQEANAKIAEILASGNDHINYNIQLPAGELTGIITVPQTPGLWNITILGAKDASGDLATTLKGGVISDAGFMTLKDLKLVGAGKNLAAWPSNAGEALAGKPNIGLDGSSIAYYFGCEFRDYDIAVRCTEGLRFGGDTTAFINNNVGIYVNTPVQSGGATDMSQFLFQDNNIAVHIAKLHPNNGTLTMASYRITSTRFIDNGFDIKNDTGKMYFSPGNYFEHNGNTTDILDKRTWLNGKTYVAPVFTSYVIDNQGYIRMSNPYWGKKSTVQNGSTSAYALYADDLSGMTLTVVDQPDTANQVDVTFSFGEAATTFGLRRTRSEETFDPTVTIEKAADSIAVTINALPTGQTPTLTVSCGSWTSARVTFNGEEIESSVSGGYVSFVAEQGGTYTITNTITNTTPAPIVPPYVPVTPSIPSAPSAPDENSTTTANPDGSTTTTVTDSKTGTVTETTEYSDGTTLEIVTGANGKQSIAVSVPSGAESTVTIPAEGVTMGTVAVIVHEDGSEEVIQQSVPGEDGLTVTLSESATLKLVDKSVDFTDVKSGDWFGNAVDFVSARGIMNGVGGNAFGHTGTTTRAMVWTMLARLDGENTSGGANWYAKGLAWAKANGISDGSNADGNITREQLAVMLWRLDGSPKPLDTAFVSLGGFTDSGAISAYAQEAMAWAVSRGILSGNTNGTLDPSGNATRAHVAQIMMNYMTTG